MRIPSDRIRQPIELKMTPMIDVVFLLLVFFVWTSSFDLPEFDLPSSLAQPPNGGMESEVTDAQVESFDEIIIELDQRDGELIIDMNSQRISGTDALSRQLRAVLDLGVQPPVIIDPSDRVTMSNAVQIYDLARNEGSDRVLFAAKAE